MSHGSESDRRLYQQFQNALDLPPEQRQALLDALEAEDAELAQRLRRLLANDEDLAAQGAHTASLHAALQESLHDLNPTASQELPARIGHYRIEGRLGEGGMGVVYLARREGLAEAPAVALKLISERLRSSAARDRFLAEQRSLARLDHPAVCRFIDADTLPDGRPLVVMEAVRGEAIDAWVARRQPSVNALLRLFLQLLSAVGHAHERLIVHRDIKCSNVLVTESEQIKLLDFGIAKLMDEADTAQATATSDRFLTPGIAAPEYFSRGEVTVATDVYALGALLYRLLSGRDPLQFEGLKPAEIERQLLFVEPAALSKVATAGFKAQISGDLEAIVHKCLRKSPADRYGSADALAADLRRLLEGFPVDARTAPLLYRTRLFLRRNRAATAVAGAAAVTLIAWALSLSASLREVERQREEAVRAREASEQIAQLLESAIIEADPARRSIENVGAREIMAAAAERISPLAETQPEVFARLALIISRIELSYRRNKEAFDLAYAGFNSVSSRPGSTQIREDLRLIAAAGGVASGQYDAARDLLAGELSSSTQSDPLYALTQANLLLEGGEFEQARLILKHALLQSQDLDASSHEANELRWALSDSYLLNEELVEALDILDETLEWQRRTHPERHAWLIDTRIKRISLLHLRHGELDVESELAQVLAATIDIYGEDSNMEAFALAQAASSQRARGHHTIAIRNLLRVAAIRQRLKAPGDPGFLRAAANAADAALRGREPDTMTEALNFITVADTAASARERPNWPLGNYLRALRAHLLIRLDKVDDALQAMTDRSYPTPDQIDHLSIQNRLIRVLQLVLESPACVGRQRPECSEALERKLRIEEAIRAARKKTPPSEN